MRRRTTALWIEAVDGLKAKLAEINAAEEAFDHIRVGAVVLLILEAVVHAMLSCIGC